MENRQGVKGHELVEDGGKGSSYRRSIGVRLRMIGQRIFSDRNERKLPGGGAANKALEKAFNQQRRSRVA